MDLTINCLPIDGNDIKKGFYCNGTTTDFVFPTSTFPTEMKISTSSFSGGEVVQATFLFLILVLGLVYFFIKVVFKERVEVLNK